MKFGELFSMVIKVIFILPFLLFFLVFTGSSYIMKKLEGIEMTGKVFARSIVGAFAVISMIFVTLLGKVYE